MRRYAFVEQHAEEDCGAACVAMMARHYAKNWSFPLIRTLVGTGQQGTTLLGLKRGADVISVFIAAPCARMWMRASSGM